MNTSDAALLRPEPSPPQEEVPVQSPPPPTEPPSPDPDPLTQPSQVKGSPFKKVLAGIRRLVALVFHRHHR